MISFLSVNADAPARYEKGNFRGIFGWQRIQVSAVNHYQSRDFFSTLLTVLQISQKFRLNGKSCNQIMMSSCCFIPNAYLSNTLETDDRRSKDP